MTRPWPDEVRAMIDAIASEGVSVHVAPHVGGWRVFTPGANADYDPASQCWIRGHATMPAAVALDYLLREARMSARAQSLAARIVAAVPTASVIETTDGIEVTVGSKSVRLKREQNGWSLADDLFCSDDRVVEHAKQMAAEQAPRPLLDRLREAVPGLEWEIDEDHEDTIRGKSLQYPKGAIRITFDRTDDTIEFSDAPTPGVAGSAREVASEDEAIDEAREWYARAYPVPAAPQPSPRAQALLDALRAQGYEPTYEPSTRQFGETVVCDGESAALLKGADLWWYLGGQAGTEYVAEQMGLRISRKRERKAAPPPRLLDHEAFARLFGEQGDRIATLIEERKYEEATALIEALTEELKAKRQAPKTLTVSVSALDTDAIAATLTQASKEALEQVKQAHEAKGAQTMTKTQALTQTIKLDASEAAWRTAGSQFVKLAREPLVGLLTRHLAPNDDAFRARLAAFLETELGTALLASMLSAMLSALPQTTGEVPQKLARELRVKAMATAGDELASVLSGPLLQVMRLYLQDPAGAPAAAPALDEPQHAPASVDWSKAREVSR